MSAITPVALRTVSDAGEAPSRHLYAEQVRHLYRLSPAGYLGTLVVASIVTYALWNVVNNTLLGAWFLTVGAVTSSRYLLYRAYMASPARIDAAHAARSHPPNSG